MPHDEQLADRLRGILGETGAFTEKKMFGSLCFFRDSKMLFTANQTGDLMVRVDPARFQEHTARGAVQAMMKDRSMGPSWLVVPKNRIEGDAELRCWTGLALEFHATLA